MRHHLRGSVSSDESEDVPPTRFRQAHSAPRRAHDESENVSPTRFRRACSGMVKMSKMSRRYVLRLIYDRMPTHGTIAQWRSRGLIILWLGDRIPLVPPQVCKGPYNLAFSLSEIFDGIRIREGANAQWAFAGRARRARSGGFAKRIRGIPLVPPHVR